MGHVPQEDGQLHEIARGMDKRSSPRHPDCGMDDPIKTADEIKKAELRESVKQVLMHLLDDPQIQQKIVVLVQKQLRS
jgi:hypothetical protein